MIKFRQKGFSDYITRDALKGASLGLSSGIVLSGLGFAPNSAKKWIPGHKIYNNLRDKYTPAPLIVNSNRIGDLHVNPKDTQLLGMINPKTGKNYEVGDVVWEENASGTTGQQKLLLAAGTTILGAALGAIVGAVKSIKDSTRSTNNRLLKKILPILKSMGLVEGKDYTMDPKKANEIPTKVCIVLSSASGELQTIINSRDDRKLKQVVDRVVKMSPGRPQVTTQNNKFNEITITTEKNTTANVIQVASIIKTFVGNGYPVYIVEVG